MDLSNSVYIITSQERGTKPLYYQISSGCFVYKDVRSAWNKLGRWLNILFDYINDEHSGYGFENEYAVYIDPLCRYVSVRYYIELHGEKVRFEKTYFIEELYVI